MITVEKIAELIKANVYSHHYENCDGHNSFVDEESIADAAKAIFAEINTPALKE